MKSEVVILGRIKQGNILIGGIFYNMDDEKEYVISVSRFQELFSKCDVLNCKYYNGTLHSTWNNFNLNKLSVYNKYGDLINQGYSREMIISVANKICTCNKTLISGGRITDIDSYKAIQFAEKYYGQIRKMTCDVARIAKILVEQ